MEPPIESTIPLQIGIPRPLPMTLLTVELFSLSKGSNIFFWKSLLMPIPVSLTTNSSAE